MMMDYIYEMGYIWIETTLKTIVELDFVDKITSQSRIEKDKVYLDNDFDTVNFLKILKQKFPNQKIHFNENKKSYLNIIEKERYNVNLANRHIKEFNIS